MKVRQLTALQWQFVFGSNFFRSGPYELERFKKIPPYPEGFQRKLYYLEEEEDDDEEENDEEDDPIFDEREADLGKFTDNSLLSDFY